MSKLRTKRRHHRGAACRGDRLEPVAAPQLLGIHHLAVEELEDKGVVLRQHRDHGGTDTASAAAIVL